MLFAVAVERKVKNEILVHPNAPQGQTTIWCV